MATPEDVASALVAKLQEVGTLASAVIGRVENREGVGIKIKP